MTDPAKLSSSIPGIANSNWLAKLLVADKWDGKCDRVLITHSTKQNKALKAKFFQLACKPQYQCIHEVICSKAMLPRSNQTLSIARYAQFDSLRVLE